VNAELVAQEKQLGLERPAPHVLVEIRQVGVVVVRLIKRCNVIGGGQEFQ
jgi:hypothetical protein